MRVMLYHFLFALLLSPAIAGCKCNVAPVGMIRSGDVENDDVAEPLPKSAMKYKGILDISNQILNHFQNDEYGVVYERYISDELKQKMSLDDMISMFSAIKQKSGSMKSFKTMQWGFNEQVLGGNRWVICMKIVHHENAIANYNFVFPSELANQILAINITERKSS